MPETSMMKRIVLDKCQDLDLVIFMTFFSLVCHFPEKLWPWLCQPALYIVNAVCETGDSSAGAAQMTISRETWQSLPGANEQPMKQGWSSLETITLEGAGKF